MQPPPPWATGDPYLALPILAQYAGVSVRSLRSFLQHALHPLPHYRVGSLDRRAGRRGAKIVVKVSDYTRWMNAWRVSGPAAPPRDLGGILEAA